jgi:signal transduction histidine kinase
MQERVKTLGGTLTVQSDENGTSVLVVLPPVGEAQA